LWRAIERPEPNDSHRGETAAEPLDFAALFGRVAPIEIDLGCGDGGFLAAYAALHPERDFLGIERLVGRVRSATKRAERLRLTNVRILRAETAHTVRHLLPPSSVVRFHLSFPDPWPKRRHHRRRLVNPDFLRDAAVALVPNGTVRIATDDADYFRHIREAIQRSCLFTRHDAGVRDEIPTSTFEERFRKLAIPIHRLELRKISPVMCALASQ
jgi:tRNA (guanine-N7-)-methyltransferase